MSGYRFTEEITAKNDSNSHNNAFSKIEIQNSEIEIQNSEIEKHTRDYIQRLHSEITTSYEEKIEKEKPAVSKEANHKKEETEKNAPTSQEIVDAYNETCVSLPRVPKTDPIKSIGLLIHPRDIRMELTGPLVENSVKNKSANADAMIRFGRYL